MQQFELKVQILEVEVKFPRDQHKLYRMAELADQLVRIQLALRSVARDQRFEQKNRCVCGQN